MATRPPLEVAGGLPAVYRAIKLAGKPKRSCSCRSSFGLEPTPPPQLLVRSEELRSSSRCPDRRPWACTALSPVPTHLDGRASCGEVCAGVSVSSPLIMLYPARLPHPPPLSHSLRPAAGESA
jgi:hypothetical protein